MSKFNAFAIQLDVVVEAKADLPQDIAEYCAANNIGVFINNRENVDSLPVLFTANSEVELKAMIAAVYEPRDKEEQEFLATLIEEI